MTDVTNETRKQWRENAEHPSAADKESYTCPQCKAILPTEQGLKAHITRLHGDAKKEEPKQTGGWRRATKASVAAEDLVKVKEEFEGNLKAAGSIILIVAPHLGLTLATRASDYKRELADGSLQDKKGIGTVVMGYAESNKHVLEGIKKFNSFFRGSDAAELAIQLGTAAAIDARVLDKDMEILSGTPMAFAPARAFLGDIISEVDAQTQAQQASQPQSPAEDPAQGLGMPSSKEAPTVSVGDD